MPGNPKEFFYYNKIGWWDKAKQAVLNNADIIDDRRNGAYNPASKRGIIQGLEPRLEPAADNGPNFFMISLKGKGSYANCKLDFGFRLAVCKTGCCCAAGILKYQTFIFCANWPLGYRQIMLLGCILAKFFLYP